MTSDVDCLIIGGGPAGLTAAIYAARFRLSVLLVDGGQSRAAWIPCTRNHAGFPEGISGEALLARMRSQALKFGAQIILDRVEGLERNGSRFRAETEARKLSGRTVLLATGVTNRDPLIDPVLRREAVAAGRLRYCPVCDGYEVTDQNVAVIGSRDGGAREALFLRAFTRRVTLITATPQDAPSPADAKALTEAGVVVIQGPVDTFRLEDGGLSLAVTAGRLTFDAVYPALGSIIHSSLAAGLGGKLADDGCIMVDAHQRTSIPGLYAAGDVVIGLDQISHAMGEAGVAATTIRNDLNARSPLRR